MRRILVVDDHAIVRSGIRRLLGAREGLCLCEAASGEDALESLSRTAFDLVVLDLNLPGLAGLALLRRIAQAAPQSPVLVFSQHAEPIYAIRAMESGARGFVSKNAAPAELLAAVDAVLAGGTAVEKDIAHEIAMHHVTEDAYLQRLTPRDIEILRLLAAGSTLSDIAARLGIAYKTVANTLGRIKEKLGVAQTSELIRIAAGRGLADLS